MKKLLAMLLAVLMVLSLSAVAFANSPTQETEPAPAVVTPATEAKEDEATEEEQAAIDEAEAAEAEVADTISDTAATDENGEEAVAALGKLDEATATDEMKADFADLQSALVDSKETLAENEQDVIPEEIREDAKDKAVEAGKSEEEAANVVLVASQPFRAVAASYPATITIAVDNPQDFVGMMIFVNGKWVKLNCTDNGDGTVTFVLDNPAVLSIVSSIEEAP